MIEKLSKSLMARNRDGLKIEATHKGWGSTHQPWNRPELISYSVLGGFNDLGAFRPIEGTEEYAHITGDDYKTLTKKGITESEVIATHKRVIEREAKAAKKGNRNK